MKKILSAVLACAATMALATCAFAEEAPATAPGDTDAPGTTDKAPVEVEVKLTVDSKNGIEGAALNEQLLVKDGKKYTWGDVKEATFVSEGLFSVQFSANKEVAGVDWFTLGKDEIPAAKADEDAQWATEWALGAAEIALFDTSKEDGGYVKLIAKEDGTEISVKVTMRADATGTDVEDPSDPANEPTNVNTGIALAVAPAGLAVAFVTVAAVMSKKKKG